MMRPLKLRRDLTEVLKEKDNQINMMTEQAHKFRDMCIEKDEIIKELMDYALVDINPNCDLIRRAAETISK
jgi:hypothetical protein